MARLWCAAGGGNRLRIRLMQIVALIVLPVSINSHGGSGESSARGNPSLVYLSKAVVETATTSSRSDRLAHYLAQMMIPERLQQVSGKELSLATYNIIGLLKSHHRRTVSPVVTAIADCVVASSDRRLRSWNMMDLSMLASTFHALRTQQEAVKALKTIAGEVASRGAGYRIGEQWQERAVVSLANIFSSLEGTRARHALKTIAEEVVAQQARYKNRYGDSISPLVIVANAFARTEGRRIQAALKEIAREIVRSNGELIDRDHWREGDFAMMAGALGRSSGQRVDRALRAIARAIMSDPDPSGELRQWSSKHLSNTAIGISKNAQDADVTWALRTIAGVIAENRQLMDSEVWSIQDLAMVASGISKVTGPLVQLALRRIAAVVVERGGLKKPAIWTHQHLATMANAVIKAEGDADVTRMMVLTAKAVVHRRRELRDESLWKASDLALVANAISQVSHHAVTEALSIIAREVVRRGSRLHSAEWKPGYLSMVAGAIGKVPDESAYPALRLLARELVHRKAQLHKRSIWQVMDLVNMANAIGKVPVDKDIAEAMLALADVVADRKERLDDPAVWRLRDLSLMGNALTKVDGELINRATNSMAIAVYERRRELKEYRSWSIQDLTILARFLSRTRGEPAIDALRVIAEVVAHKDTDLTDRNEWSAQALASMALSLSKVPDRAVIKAQKRLAAVAMQWLSEPEGQRAWSASDLGILAFGMGLEACVREFEQLVDRLLASPDDVDELAWLLIRMSRWHLLDHHLQAAARMFRALVESGFHFHELGWLDELMWAATVMEYRSLQGKAEPPAAGWPFAEAFQQYHRQYQQLCRTLEASGGSSVNSTDWDEYQWHGRFARDYWKKRVPEPERKRASASELRGVSNTQSYLFSRLKTLFPGCTMETRINGFPVDIMVGSHICVELDGPTHFIPAQDNSANAPGLRLSKDGLVKHMLGRYLCQVVRIPYTVVNNERELQKHIDRIDAIRKAEKR